MPKNIFHNEFQKKFKAMQNRGRSDSERIGRFARNCLILTFLLGITW